jgi:hypothetical protein
MITQRLLGAELPSYIGFCNYAAGGPSGKTAASAEKAESISSTTKVTAKSAKAKSGVKSPLKAESKTPSAVSVPRAAAAAEN